MKLELDVIKDSYKIAPRNLLELRICQKSHCWVWHLASDLEVTLSNETSDQWVRVPTVVWDLRPVGQRSHCWVRPPTNETGGCNRRLLWPADVLYNETMCVCVDLTVTTRCLCPLHIHHLLYHTTHPSIYTVIDNSQVLTLLKKHWRKNTEKNQLRKNKNSPHYKKIIIIRTRIKYLLVIVNEQVLFDNSTR